jgi:hypothetical protein
VRDHRNIPDTPRGDNKRKIVRGPDYFNSGQHVVKRLRLAQHKVVYALLVGVCSDYLYGNISFQHILRENNMPLE